jgi:DNA-binding response OmpR family regulator
MKTNRYEFLLVDDNEDSRILVARALRMLPHELTWVETAAAARRVLKEKKFDFVLLDVELPDGDGYTLCQDVVTALPDVPIFFVTGRNSAIDLLAGFSMGAEDFINKPFRPYEFRARVIARLRKRFAASGRDFVMEANGISVNQTRHEVFVGGTPVACTSPEVRVLGHFLCNPDRAITEDSLGFAAFSAGATTKAVPVTAHIEALRKKLGAYGAFLADNEDGTYSFKPVSIAGAKKTSVA